MERYLKVLASGQDGVTDTRFMLPFPPPPKENKSKNRQNIGHNGF